MNPVILIIDDVPDIVEEMIQMLDLLDHRAIGAPSIATGIALLAENPDIRLLICDLRLRGENGAHLHARIADQPALKDRHFNTIFMSGDTERVALMIARPGCVIMNKPIDPSALIATIDHYLGLAPGIETIADVKDDPAWRTANG
jgi:DNA-binding NtrC family response regulator